MCDPSNVSPSCVPQQMPLEELEESAVLQVVFDDDVGDCIEDKLHILGISGTGEVGIDFLGFLPLVQVFKLTLDVARGFIVLIGP